MSLENTSPPVEHCADQVNARYITVGRSRS